MGEALRKGGVLTMEIARGSGRKADPAGEARKKATSWCFAESLGAVEVLDPLGNGPRRRGLATCLPASCRSIPHGVYVTRVTVSRSTFRE
jgi:hypothetical protein